MTMGDARDVIVRLLSSLGSQKEVEQYLRHYSSVESQKFAVIKVGGGVVEGALDELATSLTFLHRVGLYPIVVHGAGPQLDVALQEAGISTEKVDGLRVTTPAVLDVARRVFRRENLRLVDALEKLGTRARPIMSGVIEARRSDDQRLGLVGEVELIHDEAMSSSIRAGQLPIIASLGETRDGQILNLNADVVARAIARTVRPHKVIFLTPTGGLLDDQGRLMSAVNLEEDYEDLMAQPWVHSGMRLKLDEIKRLLEELPPFSSVSITSPERLTRELFTHRGAGTLIRRGERILQLDSFADVDRARVQGLLEQCFGRRLASDYFEEKEPLSIFLAESYRAIAIVTQEGTVPYLDKFAVTSEAQGAGIGGSLWLRMRRIYPDLFWRARVNNPVNRWYFEHSDGAYRSSEWVVFWLGLTEWPQISDCVRRALALPETLTVGA